MVISLSLYVFLVFVCVSVLFVCYLYWFVLLCVAVSVIVLFVFFLIVVVSTKSYYLLLTVVLPTSLATSTARQSRLPSYPCFLTSEYRKATKSAEPTAKLQALFVCHLPTENTTLLYYTPAYKIRIPIQS